jgi:hypothetical protein
VAIWRDTDPATRPKVSGIQSVNRWVAEAFSEGGGDHDAAVAALGELANEWRGLVQAGRLGEVMPPSESLAVASLPGVMAALGRIEKGLGRLVAWAQAQDERLAPLMALIAELQAGDAEEAGTLPQPAWNGAEQAQDGPGVLGFYGAAAAPEQPGPALWAAVEAAAEAASAEPPAE